MGMFNVLRLSLLDRGMDTSFSRECPYHFTIIISPSLGVQDGGKDIILYGNACLILTRVSLLDGVKDISFFMEIAV